MNRVKKILCYMAGMLTAIAAVLIFSKPSSACAADMRTVSDYRSYQNDTYIIQQTVSGDQVYDKNGNVLISAGRYCRIDYLGSDIFAVYKLQDKNEKMIGYKEMFSPYLYNLKKGTEKKVATPDDHPDQDLLVHPFSNGYARVENGAFYAWTPMTYYYFIDKNGKKLFDENPYTFCSDMIKLSGELYYFTVGDELSVSSGTDKAAMRTITKRDINGKKVNSVKLSADYAYSQWSLVKVGKTFYIRVYADSTKKKSCYMLYSTNLKKVTKYTSAEIKAMESYTPLAVKTSYSEDDPYFPSTEFAADGTETHYLYRDWGFISPFTTRSTCIDVSGYSKDENAWIALYETCTESMSAFGMTMYTMYGSNCNQGFIFDPVSKNDDGSMQVRIWSAHSGRQLKSYVDKENGVTRLALGSYTDKDSKKKEIKEQIFTIVENSDGSFYIKNCDGKYLTMAYGETTSGTWLVFADYAGGDAKQKFRFTNLTSLQGRDADSKPVNDNWW